MTDTLGYAYAVALLFGGLNGLNHEDPKISLQMGILNAGGGQDFGMGGQGGFGGDINDVDLEMALRASAEEYRQMEEAQARAQNGGNEETAIVNEDQKQNASHG